MVRKIFYVGPISLNLGTLVLRLSFGAIMLFSHGLPKLQQLLGDAPIQFISFMGLDPKLSLALAVFSEFFCSALLILGLLTRVALIPLIITMLVAALMVHAQDPFSVKEMSILYLSVYVSLFILGPGRFSVDSFLDRK